MSGEAHARRELSPLAAEAISEFTDLFHTWDLGTHAVSVGGSVGKGVSDGRSDIDLRLFHERELPLRSAGPEHWKPVNELLAKWKGRGVVIDGVWDRTIDEIDCALNAWIAGDVRPDEIVWTTWGYYLPTDICNQYVVEDPAGIIAGWQSRLMPYPASIKKAILDKHLSSLTYWRHDYHYANKVERRDMVFLASLSARLIHDILQVLFALNETYYVGDGANMIFAQKFDIKPDDLAARVAAALYPRDMPGKDRFRVQQEIIAGLIDDVFGLVGE